MPVWYEIRSVSGLHVLSRTHSVSDKWQWIKNVIRAHAECDDEHIDIEETDAGDVITVMGKPYARVFTEIPEDFSETEEHKQAEEEREIFKASAAAQVEIARLRAQVAYLKREVDTWRERYEDADEVLTKTIRDFDRLLNEVR